MVELVKRSAGGRFTNSLAALIILGIHDNKLSLPTGIKGFNQKYLQDALSELNPGPLDIQIKEKANGNHVIQIFSPDKALQAQLTYTPQGKLIALANDPVVGIEKYEIDTKDPNGFMHVPAASLVVKPADVAVHKMLESNRSYYQQR